jgi:adenosylhomocysteinase
MGVCPRFWYRGRRGDAVFLGEGHATSLIIGKMSAKVYNVSAEIDAWVAKLKLESMGVGIDTLTAEQVKYLSSHDMGT